MKRSLNFARMNLRVGIMVMTAVTIALVVIFSPIRGLNPFKDRTIIYGKYKNASSLRRNSPVFLNGVEVGKVVEVEIINPLAEYPILVTVEVLDRIMPMLRDDTTMKMVSIGLLGDVFIDLQMGEAQGATLVAKAYLPTGELESFMAAAADMRGDVEDILVQVKQIIGRANAGGGTVGRLLRDDELYMQLVDALHEIKNVSRRISEIEDTINKKLLDPATKDRIDKMVASTGRVIDRVDGVTQKVEKLKWHIELGAHNYEGPLYMAEAGLRIIPSDKRFYYGGVEWFNEQGPHTADDEAMNGYLGVTAALGFKVANSPFYFRGGAKRSFVAAGLDFRMEDLWEKLPLQITADAYRFQQPNAQFDVGGDLRFLDVFSLSGGVDDVLNTPRYRLGLKLIYDDEDLTSILVKSQF